MSSRPGEWSYVAFGHYHVQTPLGPRAWYSGALEYVSTNPWGELREEAEKGVAGKAWLLVDLDSGVAEAQKIVPARRVLDLSRLDGTDLAPDELQAAISARVEAVPGGIDDQVVRLVVTGVPRHVARQLDHAILRRWKAEALHFQLDVRRPEPSPARRRRRAGPAADASRHRAGLPQSAPVAGGNRPRRLRERRRGAGGVRRARVGGRLMQIHRLRLVNFRQHEDSELVLGAGLTGIVGANGAGKSTLLEAIAFAMYGTPAARGTRDSIRRRGAPPRSPVRVELDFALGAHEFRVVRSLSQAELFQDGDPAPIANSLGTVTEKLSHLLGMTRAEFFNTYFTGQKDLMVMATMSAPERAQFLARVLGFERLRLAQEQLKETRSELRARLQALQAGLVDAGALDAEEQRVAGAGRGGQRPGRQGAGGGAVRRWRGWRR